MSALRSAVTVITSLAVALGAVAVGLALAGQDTAATALIGGALATLALAMLLGHRNQLASNSGFRKAAQRDTRALVFEVRSNGSRQATEVLTAAHKQFARAEQALAKSEQQMIAEKKKLHETEQRLVAEANRTIGNTANHHGAYFGIGPDFEYGERARLHASRFETFALRSKSIKAREALARASTNMQFGYQDTLYIVRALRAGRAPGGIPLVRQWHQPSLLALARVVTNQRFFPTDTSDAAYLFRLVKDVFGSEALGRTDIYTFSECLADLGLHSQALSTFGLAGMRRRDPIHNTLIQANAVQASGLEKAEERDKWASLINSVLAVDGRAPIALGHNPGLPPFDALGSHVSARTLEGPMVSILVPTFNGTKFLATTLKCLTAQTWKNLEVIVIDDCSDEPHAELLSDICAQFANVVLLRQERNLGAYLARNRGLAAATGEYLTVHDDDDWSHPQKIETQVLDLVERGPGSANMTRHARTSEDLRLTRINNNPAFSQPNFSSLMFHRSIIDTVGAWDQVNRGADAEFRDRIVQATGSPVEVLGAAPLSFTRTHDASLTAGEIGRGYLDPARVLYQAAYMLAHSETLADQGVSGTVGVLSRPRFARPASMLPGAQRKHLGRFDVVFSTDFRFPGGTSMLTLNEIELAVGDGLRVGVVQLDSPLNSPTSPISPRLLHLAKTTDLEILSLRDHANVDALLVRHPSVLQFLDNQVSNLTIGVVRVVVNNPPILTGGKGMAFSFSDVIAHSNATFGVEPQIVPESGVTAAECQRIAPAIPIVDTPWPGFVDTDRFSPSPTREDRTGIPVLGRHSRDSILKWPDASSAIGDVYFGDENMEVRILGGVNSLPEQIATQLEARAQVIAFGGQDPAEFLRGLDFWAYYHSDKLTESFGMGTVEAMASGLVVFLPDYMEPTFGDGAIYVAPQDVRRRVLEIWSDPQEYRRLSERAREVALERFSAGTMRARLHEVAAEGRSQRLLRQPETLEHQAGAQ